MSEAVLRVAAVGVLALAAVGIGLVAARWSRPSHPTVDLDGLGLPPGLVLFTSTGCSTCLEARVVAESFAVPIREVTNELEPALLERARVEAVPLTVVVDRSGRVVARFAGVPRRRALAKAIRKAGGGVLGTPDAWT